MKEQDIRVALIPEYESCDSFERAMTKNKDESFSFMICRATISWVLLAYAWNWGVGKN